MKCDENKIGPVVTMIVNSANCVENFFEISTFQSTTEKISKNCFQDKK